MDADELATLVDELDLRVERLRVLYDQYFMGIEKIPPEVLKKDVERRMWVLRREKIRNTGTRFRFQQITQRLNTFQSYWMRICREIENGTYKRDVMRAKKRFGPSAGETAARATRAEPAATMSEAPASGHMLDALDDVDIDLDEPESDRREETLDEEFPPLFPDTARMSVAPKASPPPPAPTHRPGPPGRPPPIPSRIAPTPPRAPTNTALPSPPASTARMAPAPIATSAQGRPTAQANASLATGPVAQRGAGGPPAQRIPGGGPIGARIPVGGAAAARPSDPRSSFVSRPSSAKIPVSTRPVRNDQDLDAMLDEALGSPAPRASKPETKPQAKAEPQPKAEAKIEAKPAQPAPKPKEEPKPQAPKIEPKVEPKVEPKAAPKVEPRVEPARPVHRPAAAAAPLEGDRQVYARYVDMKRKNGESTAGLTYESLQRSIEATRTKLKDRSGGKAIDFDVVVKDGKTILKPVVK